MDKELIRAGEGERAIDYWRHAAAATFKFRVFRADGSILDDSTKLCKSMEPSGTFKILMDKKFKVLIFTILYQIIGYSLITKKLSFPTVFTLVINYSRSGYSD